jgi:integrase
MASIGQDPGGRKRILFVAGDGSRKTVRLGKASRKQAEAFKIKLENLVAGRLTTGAIDDETARWVASLEDSMHAKLAAVGLLEPRVAVPTTPAAPALPEPCLGELLDGYIQARDDVKPNTRIVLSQSRRNLIAFFGPDKPLKDITDYDAEEWCRYLKRQGLSEGTIRKRTGNAKQFFRAAVKRRLIPSNPFAELASSAKRNEKRLYYVNRADAQKVLDACPDNQWRLIFALCRFGGVRCPSEILTLKWADVNWEQGRVLIHSPKTEHHEGGESRLIPLFPELLPPLRDVFEEAAPGTEYAITRYRQRNQNLRTQLHRIIRKAGLQPWPKTFQNLRSTRETELTESFPLHVVTAWIGNSQPVARKHYLQVTEDHFARAAHNPAQQSSATPCERPQNTLGETVGNTENARENTVLQNVAGGCNYLQSGQVGDEGIEPSTAALRVRCSTN